MTSFFHSLKNIDKFPVFWVIISLSLVMIPHIARFPVWSSLLIVILFIWRLLCIKHVNWLAPKWLIFIISVLSFGGVYLYFGTPFGKTAGSVILSILLALKLHESQSVRDYMLLISLSFFIIITNFLFSQNIPTVLLMLLSVVVLVMSLLSINQGSTNLSLKYKFKFASKILLQAIPLMLIMFVFFPRISGPLWKLPDEKQIAQTGLSDTMSPGNISSLIQSNKVAFRVKFDNSIPEHNKLYWRALVLWYFDGSTWERGNKNLSPLATLYTSSNSRVHYTVTLEPHQKKWLYALDMPTSTPDNIHYSNNYTLQSPRKVTGLFQYKISSALTYFTKAPISLWEKSAGLKIPLNTNLKTLQLGKALSQKYKTNDEIINHVLRMFNQQNFHYTLNPPLTPGFNAVDQFLFQTKRGFCEHYASSFTLLMRAAGIPARVVLGFQGGTINPLNKIMTIRNSDAHAWSEVWINNKGWVRIDPTAAIAPQRIEHNLESALDINEERPFHMQINSGFIKEMLFYWDALDNQWNQWIVGYDKNFQQKLLEKIFNQKINFTDSLLLMFAGFALITLIIGLFILKPWQQKKMDPLIKSYEIFCKKLACQGILREAHEGPVDFAQRAIKKLPESKDSITLITRLYTKLRYESSSSEKQFNQFKYLTRKFKPEKIKPGKF